MGSSCCQGNNNLIINDAESGKMLKSSSTISKKNGEPVFEFIHDIDEDIITN